MLFILITWGCSTSKSNEPGEVNRMIYRLIKADNKADIETILNCYAGSIEFYPAGKPFISGIDSVRKRYEILLANNILNITTNISSTKVFEKDALAIGVYTGYIIGKAAEDTTILNDRYIALLAKNSKNQWKITRLIWGLNNQ